MIKADENKSLFVIAHHPKGELIAREKSDFIRFLSSLIRGKCRFYADIYIWDLNFGVFVHDNTDR